MKKHLLIATVILWSYAGVAQDSLRFGFAVESWNDVVNNVLGGIKQGTVYKGLLAFDPEITYGNFGFKGSFCYSFGQSPSKALVGDMHTLSNIDTDIHFFIFESYLFLMKNGFSLKTGIINMNEEFILCENAEYLINSSFGIPSHITHNTPVSVYPKTTLGLNVSKKIGDKNRIKIGLYDGFPEENKKDVIKSAIHLNDGLFFISEIHNEWRNNHTKIGLYHHTGSFANIDSSEKVESHEGFYVIICPTIHTDDQYKLSVFSQFSHSLKNTNHHHYYIGGGFALDFKQFNKNKLMQLALGIAHIGNRAKMQGETVLELVFSKSLTKYLIIQPDVQYVINPSGYICPLNNALTLNVRVLFRFEKG